MFVSTAVLGVAGALTCSVRVTDLHAFFAIAARVMPCVRVLRRISVWNTARASDGLRLVDLTILVHHAGRIPGLILAVRHYLGEGKIRRTYRLAIRATLGNLEVAIVFAFSAHTFGRRRATWTSKMRI